jgi:hypothetical protein
MGKALPFPYGAICDAYLVKPPPSSLAINSDNRANIGEAWYPVVIESADPRLSGEQLYRVRFIGFEYVTLVPLSHLRPLSAEFSKCIEGIRIN